MPTNEVIRLTIAADSGDATQEDCALLCRMIEHDPRAVDVYIRTIQDTLALRNIFGFTPKKQRRAVSLVELLVVMSACALILTMSAALVHRMMHVQSKSQGYLDVERSALRLSNQFRRDVHEASVASVDTAELNEGVFLQLRLPDGRAVDYSNLDGEVTRLVSHDGKVISRDQFTLSSAAELTIREEVSPRNLILSISSRSEDGKAREEKLSKFPRTLDLQVEACLGRKLQYAQAIASERGSK